MGGAEKMIGFCCCLEDVVGGEGWVVGAGWVWLVVGLCVLRNGRTCRFENVLSSEL